MSYVTNPAPPQPRRLWPRFVFPFIVLAVCGGLIAMPFVGDLLGMTDDEMVIPLMMAAWFAIPLGVVLLGIWWLFFSPFRWSIRLALVGLVVLAAPAMFYFTVRKVELTTIDAGLVPVFHFKWQPSALQRFEEHQRAEAAPDEVAAVDLTVGPEDFPRYRGPKMVGVVTHIKLDTDWVRNPPKVLWRRPCVEGYSGLAVAGNVVLTMEQRGGEEAVVCYDRATGRQIWAYPYDAFHKDQMGNGPRATPTIHDGLIFTLGATGELVCLNAKKELQWSHNILRDADAKKIQWGMTGSPLIVNDLVIAHAGVDPDISPTQRPGTALIAYDYKIGEKRWAVANRKAGYSSPQLVTLAKVQQILLFDGEALGGFDPKTGKQLWMTPWITKMDMNMIQPVIIGDDQVFISSELDNGCALLQIKPSSNSDDPWTVETVWKTKSLAARFANPVYDGKNIYGLQFLNGVLRCVDVKDGSLRWSGERYGPGQMLLVNDVLLIVSDKGEVSLLATDTAEPKVLARFAALDEKTWNTPTLAGDQLFIRNQKEIVCLKLPRK